MKKAKKNLLDVSCILYILTTLAFHDKKLLFIGCQLFFVFISILYSHNKNKGIIKKSVFPYYFWYFLFFVYSALSGLWSINRSTYITILISILQVAVMGICIINYVKNENKIKNIIFAIIIASLIICLRLFISVPLGAWGSERVGTYIGYGTVGVTYLLGYSSIIAFYIGKREKTNSYYILSLLFIFVSSMTGTKKGVLAFLVGVFVILTLDAKNPIMFLKNAFIFAIICLVGYYAIMNVTPLYNAIGTRIESALGQINGNTLDKSTRDRMLLISYAWNDFKQHPLFGIGIDSFRFSPNNPIKLYAHNNYLEMLADLGLLGTLIYYSIFIMTLVKTLNFKEKKYGILCLSLLISLLIGDISSVSFFQETLQIFVSFIFGITCYYLLLNTENKNKLKMEEKI